MNQDSITRNLQRLGLFVAVWLCAACTSTATPELATPTQVSCAGDSHPVSAERFQGCAEIVGDLRIENTTASDLHQLAALRSVTGTLTIQANPQLKSLRGLDQLQHAREVVIVNNPKLESVASLSRLEHADRVSIAHNPELEQVSGFDALERVGSLMIMKNAVTRVSGFDRLESADQICISDNSRLIYLSGLKQLTLVEDLILENNPRLAPLPHMLPSLAHVGGELRLSGSPGVTREQVLGPELGARMEVASR